MCVYVVGFVRADKQRESMEIVTAGRTIENFQFNIDIGLKKLFGIWQI